MARQLRSVDDLLAPAIAETVANLDTAPEDAGAVRLAERYAAQIDEAATIAAELADISVDDENDARQLHALSKRVEAQAVLAELGPKLLTTLESLGATPKARAVVSKGGKPAVSRLQVLRDQARRA